MKSSFESYLRSPFRSVKHTTYFDVYDRIFGPYVGKPITFVEVGVLGGGSLFMWRDFFGESARIVGVDLNPAAKKWEEHGFEIHIGNQADPRFWHEFFERVGEVDILLDDGGHTYLQQATTLNGSIEWIRDGGLLVVEDTHTSYMAGFGPKERSFISLAKRIVDSNNYRFGGIAKTALDFRSWSVQFFESFVVFHIDKAKTALSSAPTDNGGEDDHAMDFRHSADPLISWFDELASRLGSKKSAFFSFVLGGLRGRLVAWFIDRPALARIFKSEDRFKKLK
jgi:hypothetical protein